MTIITSTRVIEICNNALIKIGQDTIKSFDQTPRGEACSVIFEQSLEAVLTQFTFEFSKKTAILTKLANRDGYQIPPDMIFAVGLKECCSCCDECESFHTNTSVGMVITDNALYINKPLICACGCGCDILVYISGDYNSLPSSALFDKSLIALIASDLTIRFSGNHDLQTKFFKEYLYWIDQAKRRQTIKHDRTGDPICDIPYFRNKVGYLL